MKIALLLLSTSVALAVIINDTTQPRIVGEFDAEDEQFPFVASAYAYVEKINEYILVCGGAIISEVSILTSVICAYGCSTGNTDCKVIVGSTINDGRSGIEVKIIDYIYHESFEGPAESVVDLGIIRVRKIPLSNTIQIVKLPTQDLSDLQKTIIMGWGESPVSVSEKYFFWFKMLLKCNVSNIFIMHFPLKSLSPKK